MSARKHDVFITPWVWRYFGTSKPTQKTQTSVGIFGRLGINMFFFHTATRRDVHIPCCLSIGMGFCCLFSATNHTVHTLQSNWCLSSGFIPSWKELHKRTVVNSCSRLGSFSAFLGHFNFLNMVEVVTRVDQKKPSRFIGSLSWICSRCYEQKLSK